MNFTGKKSRAAGRSRGFSLIELLIVVAIILIIAAIAIPNLLRARIAANEASAANSVRSINTAEFAYSAQYPTNGYAVALANKSGYVFAATGLLPNGAINLSFISAASPVDYNRSGVRDFCSTEDGVIRFDAGGPGKLPVNTLAACRAFSIMQ